MFLSWLGGGRRERLPFLVLAGVPPLPSSWERTWDWRPGKNQPGTASPPPFGQTDTRENSTFPILRMRAVMTVSQIGACYLPGLYHLSTLGCV